MVGTASQARDGTDEMVRTMISQEENTKDYFNENDSKILSITEDGQIGTMGR